MEPCRRRPRHNRTNYRDSNSHQRHGNNIAYQMPFNGRHETNQGTGIDIYHPKDYPQKLLNNMQLLRSKQKFCDVIITVNGKAFHCHKAFLASGSPYFEAMFSSGLVEEEQQTVEIHGITPEVFTLLLDFMYLGKIEIHQENVQDLLAAANMLELPDVVDACCNFLRKELHPSNSVGIYRFAELHSCTNLRLEAKRFIERFFPQVLQEDEIYDLPKEMMINFIRSEGLAIENEYQVFQFTIEWILRDPSARRKHIFDLINLIRLPVISERQLDLAIADCPDLSLKVALSKLIQDHKTQMRLIQLDKRLGQEFDVRMQPRMCTKKYIYIIGGYNRDRGRSWDESHTLSLVEKLDVNKDQWTAITSMRNSRSGHGVAVLYNVIYVLGGESDSMIYNSCEAYDPLSNEWTPIRCMSQTRSVLGACALDGYIYAIGGWVGAEIGDSIERYDPLTDTWTSAGKMNTARFAMGIVAHDGLIYVIGGLSELNEAMDMVESFNPITGEWNTLARLITPRAHVGVALLRDHIYAVGGTNSSRPCLSSVERYSIEENKWSEILPMKFHKAGACAAAVNGKLYVIGGRRGMDRSSVPMTLNDVEIYDPEKNEWRKSASISTGRCEAAIAVV